MGQASNTCSRARQDCVVLEVVAKAEKVIPSKVTPTTTLATDAYSYMQLYLAISSYKQLLPVISSNVEHVETCTK